MAHLEVGHATWLRGEHVAAQSHAVEALGLCRKLEDMHGILASLESLAAAALAQGRKERAARLLGAVEPRREVLVQHGEDWWRRPRERMGEAVRSASPGQEFAAAWAEGRVMTMEQVVEYALKEIPGAHHHEEAAERVRRAAS